jgi:hypothetical protein
MSKGYKTIYVTYNIEIISCRDKPVIFKSVLPKISPTGSKWVLLGKFP